MTKIWGIDISTWQRGYPYAQAKKEGIKFAILRAGFSETKDNMFETHYKNAKAQGWGVGAYWYTYAKTVYQANREAKAFLKAIKGKKFEYPIYLDMEDRTIRGVGRTTLNNIVKEFNKVIRGAGYYFGVYTNVDWYRNVISGSTLNKTYDWWIASWTSSKPSGINAGMWQFGGSSNAIRSPRVAGVVTDQNYAFKDYPTIMKQRGLNGYSKTATPKPTPSPSYKTGDYVTLDVMKVRTGAGTKYRQKLVKELTADGRKNATSTNSNANACYKKGTVFTALQIIKNGNDYWAKTPSGYICIQQGKTIYCKKK